MATISNIMSMLVRAKVQANDPISEAMMKKYIKVQPDSSLGLVSRILEKDSFAVVVNKGCLMNNRIDLRNVTIFFCRCQQRRGNRTHH